MAVWETIFHLLYRGEDGRTYERSNPILFEADSVSQAVADSVRFYNARVASEANIEVEARYWARLGCMKVSQMTIHPIAADGAYDTRRSMCAYEWKCDWGLPLGES